MALTRTPIIDTPCTVAFDALLCDAADAAKKAYPAEHTAIGRGLAIALAAGVVLYANGKAQVKSDTIADAWYEVNGVCTCKNFRYAPGGRCKHRWAKSLVKHAYANGTPKRTEPEYFATYYPPTGEMIDGRAQQVPAGWRFTPNDGSDPLHVHEHALCLGGEVGLYQDQLVADGNLVEKVCSRDLMSWHIAVDRPDGSGFSLAYQSKEKAEMMAEYWQSRGYHVTTSQR